MSYVPIFNPCDLSLVYEVANGLLFLGDNRDALVCIATGYAGAPSARNDPDRQDEKGVGPIPVGVWHIDAPKDHPRLGPQAFHLEPDKAVQVYGRSGFFIHGDNSRGGGSASNGCIVLNRRTRDLIAYLWWCGVRTLYVRTGWRDGFPPSLTG